MPVVYRILNVVSGRMYIGSALDFEVRRRLHLSHLRRGIHHSAALQRAFAKYGEDMLVFKIMDTCEAGELVAREQAWMDAALASGAVLYNCAPTAGSMLGFIHGPESRAKMSASMRGRVISPEHRAKLSAALKGRPKSAEHIRNAAAAQRGRKLPEKQREEQIARLRAWHAENGWPGRAKKADAHAL